MRIRREGSLGVLSASNRAPAKYVLFQREPNGEFGATSPPCAFYTHGAAMQLHETFNERQAHAGTAASSVDAVIRLGKGLKNTFSISVSMPIPVSWTDRRTPPPELRPDEWLKCRRDP